MSIMVDNSSPLLVSQKKIIIDLATNVSPGGKIMGSVGDHFVSS